MRWEDERYVRLYKRDTADWLALSFDAQGLFCLLLRKVDLSGRLELGRHGTKAVAAVINQVALWDTRLKPALDELLKDGCVRVEGEALLIPNYVSAQEATMSGKLRTRLYRERQEANGSPPETESVDSPDERHESATKRHGSVTETGELRRAVTPAEPAEPALNQPAEPDRARTCVADPWPTRLLADLRRALGRKQLETNDRPWQDFVIESLKYPVEIRQQAALEYIRRGSVPGQHAPAYVLAMIRDGASKPEHDAPPNDGSYRSPEETKRMMDEICPPNQPHLSRQRRKQLMDEAAARLREKPS